MNPRMRPLQPYPFARLNTLLSNVEPSGEYSPIALSLGEPRHPPPQFVIDRLADPVQLKRDLATYPATRGSDELRIAIAEWVQKRFAILLDPGSQVLPVNGTREALFSFPQAVLSGAADSNVLMPNPFYQIYEGAALLGGAQPLYINNDPTQDYT